MFEKTYKEHDSNQKLEEKITESLQLNEVLRKEVDTRLTITKKTELSFNNQSELVKTKEEVITNQRIIIENFKKFNCSSVDTSNGSEHPGLQESFLCLSNIALHEVVLNGFFEWGNIQRRTTAENNWKEESLKKFTKEELTDAKEILWDVADESVFRKNAKTPRTNKTNLGN